MEKGNNSKNITNRRYEQVADRPKQMGMDTHHAYCTTEPTIEEVRVEPQPDVRMQTTLTSFVDPM